MIVVFTKKAGLSLALLFLLGGVALGQAVQVKVFTAGPRTVYWFGNGTGKAVDGLRIMFDGPVTLTGKLEVFGGLTNVTGTSQGTEFLFQGKLAPAGFVELRWEPAGAKPVLAMWLSGGKPAGMPYVTSVPALIKVLAEGLVALRTADPGAFSKLLETFFTTNPNLARSLGQLGLTPQVLTGMLMVAPADGIENLLLTLVSSFGLDTVDKFMGALDWSLIFKALGF
ncbi:MAG: hypothetical protein N2320_03380 [Candidatus Bipolaricaulota bacterium]|nr:hypothetical protein [Candidatus Bipolaricaulota bacterium]